MATQQCLTYKTQAMSRVRDNLSSVEVTFLLGVGS